jgi:ribonuclease P protein component
MRETFNKAERLCSHRLIEELFKSGNAFFSYPFRVVWSETDRPLSHPAQIAIAVPSRHFKKAVSRNLIKRRIREAYRRQKDKLYNPLQASGKKVVFMIQYTSKDIIDYRTIETGLAEAISRLAREAAINH